MKELSERKRTQILRLFLEGHPYDDISAETGVAKGTVVNVVNDFRAGRFPGFGDLGDLVDTLREFSVELRRKGAGVSQALLQLPLLALTTSPLRFRFSKSWLRNIQELKGLVTWSAPRTHDGGTRVRAWKKKKRHTKAKTGGSSLYSQDSASGLKNNS